MKRIITRTSSGYYRYLPTTLKEMFWYTTSKEFRHFLDITERTWGYRPTVDLFKATKEDAFKKGMRVRTIDMYSPWREGLVCKVRDHGCDILIEDGLGINFLNYGCFVPVNFKGDIISTKNEFIPWSRPKTRPPQMKVYKI